MGMISNGIEKAKASFEGVRGKKSAVPTRKVSPVSRIKPAVNKLRRQPSVEKSPSKEKTSERMRGSFASQISPGLYSKEDFLGHLPYSYNETKLILLVRDPYWAYSYWDFSGETWGWIEDLRRKKSIARYILRILNLDERSSYDIDVQLETKNWYLHLGLPDHAFEAELGMIDTTGRFYLIARSNRIRTPSDGPSKDVDGQWNPDDFEEIYKLSGGGKTGHGSEIFSHFARRKS